MNRCLRLVHKISKKKNLMSYLGVEEQKQYDLKKNYLKTLDKLGIKLQKGPIIDNHIRGISKVEDQTIIHDLRLEELKDQTDDATQSQTQEIQDIEEEDQECSEKDQSVQILWPGDQGYKIDKSGEDYIEREIIIEGEVQEKPARKIKRKWVSQNFELKRVRNQKTFEAPSGEISDLLMKKFIKQKQQISQHNQQLMEEYMNGESKIDRKNADPRYRTKLQQLINIYTIQQEQKEFQYNPDVILRDSYQTIAKLKRYRKEMEFKEEKGDYEAFWDLVKSYPGSRFGPLPEDDPENFYKFIKGRVPGSVKQRYRRATGQFLIDQQKDEQNPKVKLARERQNYNFRRNIKRTPITFRDVLSQSRFREEEQYLEGDHNEFGKGDTFNVEDNFLPALPEFQFRDYQSNWQMWLMWQKFKFYYGLLHHDQVFVEMANYFTNVDFSIYKPKTLGSLFNYYRTLPKFLQEHEGVKTVYLGLEYKSPEWTISQKEQALNKAALMCLPLQEACDMMMQKHFTMDKYRLSAYEIDRIHNIKPQFTYDIEDFFNEIKQQKLRGERIGETKALPVIDEFEYGIPKSEAPSLPVDFYDNKDGFWDNYIKDKSNRGTPVMRGRQYFKH